MKFKIFKLALDKIERRRETKFFKKGVGLLKRLIITNNPLVKEEFDDVRFIEGSFLDVLIEVRNLVHEGCELISHPLGASIRMLFSPYRSIIVGQKNEKIDPFYVETIENSIINYKKNMKFRKVDTENGDDYALIDKELLKATLESLKDDFGSDFI